MECRERNLEGAGRVVVFVHPLAGSEGALYHQHIPDAHNGRPAWRFVGGLEDHLYRFRAVLVSNR